MIKIQIIHPFLIIVVVPFWRSVDIKWSKLRLMSRVEADGRHMKTSTLP